MLEDMIAGEPKPACIYLPINLHHQHCLSPNDSFLNCRVSGMSIMKSDVSLLLIYSSDRV